MVHLFLNCDEYLATQAIAALRAAISDNAELADLNYAEHEGERIRAVDLLAEADMMPFLTERRMIRVNGYFTHLSKRLKPKRKASDIEEFADDEEDAADDTPASARAEAEAILNGLANAPETCDLVFFDPIRQTERGPANSVDLGGTVLGKGIKPDARTGAKGAPSIPDLVKAQKVVLHHLPAVNPDPRRPDLTAWIVKHGQERTPKVKIEQEAATLLATWIGGDLRRLAGEIEKLSLYAGKRAVTAADVRLMVADESEEKMWNLTDGLSARNAKMAMTSLAELLLQDDKLEFMILASIAGNYRTIARVKALMARGLRGEDQIAAELGASPYTVKKAMGIANRFTEAQLARIMDRVFQANVNMVTGGDQQTELQLLVADLTL